MGRMTGIAVTLLSAVSLAWGETQVVMQDNFDDGVRDTTQWKASRYLDGLLAERNGRLCFSCFSGTGMGRWTGKQTFTLWPGDTLEFEALVSSGNLLASPPSQRIELGLGFRDSAVNPTKSCVIYVGRTSTGLFLLAESQAAGDSYKTFTFNTSYNRNILNLKYSAATGKISLSVRSPGSPFAVILGTVPLNRWWGIPVGQPAPLTPCLTGFAYNFPVGYPAKMFFDNAVVKITAP